MPGWHEATKQLQQDGEIQLLGITQEQHPERCQLFAQWKGFDWPILHDPLGIMGATAVPLVVAIDEHGVVRQTRPRPDQIEASFLDVEFEPSDVEPKWINLGPDHADDIAQKARSSESPIDWRDLGDSLYLWASRDSENLRPNDRVISVYEQALSYGDPSGRTDFRLGVAYRDRFETSGARPDDFQAAVDSWQAALDADPNQYIWRRRIQQYGPRLDKPYPFYDWIDEARSDIVARGETPISLPVEPRGAEIAQPSRQLDTGDDVASGLADRLKDPSGRVHRDQAALIASRAIVVQGTGNASLAYRVHLEFMPSETAHWNNETDPMVIWVETRDGVKLESEAFVLESPESAESNELRRVEFELHLEEALDEPLQLKAYALYNVCEEQGGQCLFLRQDLQIVIE